MRENTDLEETISPRTNVFQSKRAVSPKCDHEPARASLDDTRSGPQTARHLDARTLCSSPHRICPTRVYDVMEHPALFISPREASAQGMELAGARSHRVITYSEAFLMQTRPTTRTGKAKIYRGRGITVNGLQYWHERMMASDIAGQTVPVRFEPYDMGMAYAYIDGQWLECIADTYAQVHGRSEKEWNLILDEWREHQRQHAQKRVTLNGPLLAQFLHQIEQEEAFTLQHEREYEEQALRSASLGPHLQHSRSSDELLPEITIDFTKLRSLEEYC